MSTPVAWSTLTLCTIDDIAAEARDLSQFVRAGDDGTSQERIQVKIDLAKARMYSRLKVMLPKRFADTANGGVYGGYTSSYGGYGITRSYTLTELETMLDKITNPEVLTLAAAAKTIELLLDDSLLGDTMLRDRTPEDSMKLVQHWEKKFSNHMNDAVALLLFDLNLDGKVDDSERAIENDMIWKQ